MSEADESGARDGRWEALMTPLERVEKRQDEAVARGDLRAASDMQEAIDDLRDAIRCVDCGAIVHLEVMPSGNGYVSIWVDFRGGSTHFNPGGGFPLMGGHRA